LRPGLKHTVPLGALVAAIAVMALWPAMPTSGGSFCLAGPPDGESPCLILAQVEEGDIDESFEAYGDDSDEIFEYDDALMAPLDSLVEGIEWLGHASFLIDTGPIIYIDPYDISEAFAKTLPKADIVLVTHDHPDHFSPEVLKLISKPATVVVSIKAVTENLPKEIKHSRTIAPGDTLTLEGVGIEAVPAYNIDKKFHPKEKGYVGFVIDLGDRIVYHAGDTDVIPEMRHIKADIALLPVGGTYTMDAIEAAEAADIIRPKVAVPMHWGKIVGTWEDAKEFQARAKVPVLVLEKVARPDEE
jgi:L-ascorbate metabolism protein UlaG (beta-lactamase superfamily)